MNHLEHLNNSEEPCAHLAQEGINDQKANFPLHYLAEWFDGSVQHHKWFEELLREGHSLETQDNFGCTVFDYIQNNPDLVAYVAAYLDAGVLEETMRRVEKLASRRQL